MTTCLSGVCGTGGPIGPLPGDPDNNSILNATPAYGGINLNWTLPGQNPHAVAMVKIFRNVSSDFSTAMFLSSTGNNFYKDPVLPPTRYYYWIQIISINGTVNAPIGPADSVALLASQETLEQLSGLIDESVLSNALKEEIDKITLNYAELTQEIADRIANNAELSAAMAELQEGLIDSLALVNTEITTRTEGDNALATQMNIVAALNSSNAAAIISEQTARVTADSALASNISSVLAATNANAAALITEQTARTNQDSALASSITTAQATLNGEIASARSDLTAEIEIVDGKTVALGARWTATVDVGGLVGGFGVYNDGSTIDAGFNVDRFWIGRDFDAIKPFIITGGVVYIDKALIKSADIDTLKIAGNAVTVPTSVKQIGTINGTGNYEMVCGVVVSNVGNFTPMNVILIAGGLSGYSAGIRTVSFNLEQNLVGVINEITNISGSYVDTPTLMGAATIPANNIGIFSFNWKGADSTVTISGGNIVALGVKR